MRGITKAALGVCGTAWFLLIRRCRSGMICAGANAYGHPAASGRRSGGIRRRVVEPCWNFVFRLGARPRRNRGGCHRHRVGSRRCRRLELASAIAPAALAFAFLGTLVGAFTIAVGIGPQTRADFVLHALLLLGLALGLVTTWPKRTPR